MRAVASSAVILSLLITGCATKRYGRLQPLTGVEQAAYTCRDIEIEISKVRSFQEQVANGAQFNMASVLGILGDYGIGNSMERGSADRSAMQRMNQLQDLKAQRGCAGTTLSTADYRAAVGSVGNSAGAMVSTDPNDAPGTIFLGRSVKLVPTNTLSGYCISAPPGYQGTGASNSPAATIAKPICH